MADSKKSAAAKKSRYAALLRGINVGGHKMVAMAELRKLLEECGYADCVTYLQSGNAVFTTSTTSPKTLQATLEEALLETFGLDISVMIRTDSELAEIIAHNPFPDHTADGSKLFVMFFATKPKADAITSMRKKDFAPEQLAVTGREMYMWCPDGIGKSKLGKFPLEKHLGVGTTRNWNTVTKLAGLTKLT